MEGRPFSAPGSTAPKDSSRSRIVLIIPAYNEDRFIGSVVLKARQYVDTVIVVDDGSADSTQTVAEAAGAAVIRHPFNQGKGAALNTGLEAARHLDADAVVFMDADGQHDPAHIPDIASALREQQADIVIGSRFLDRPNQAPLYRRLGQRVVTFLTNAATGVRVTDTWSGFRALSRRAIGLVHFRETGWGIEPEFQFQARQHNLKTIEVAIDADYSQPAKRNPVMHGWRTVSGIMRLLTHQRPLRVFSSIGLVSILAGIGSGIWVVERYLQLKQLAAGFALISVALVLLGMLTLYTAMIVYLIKELLLSISSHRGPVSEPDRGPLIESDELSRQA